MDISKNYMLDGRECVEIVLNITELIEAIKSYLLTYGFKEPRNLSIACDGDQINGCEITIIKETNNG
jgi:hypothetical protein